MPNDLLGVAIHGCGEVAHAHAASWKRNPHVRIVSVGSRRRASAERLVGELGLDCDIHERFEDVLVNPLVDIVNLSGPNHVHAPQGIAAAEAGKHILIEKPICLSMDENRRLRDAVSAHGVRSVVSFVLRWNPLFENLKSLLAAGAVGEVNPAIVIVAGILGGTIATTSHSLKAGSRILINTSPEPFSNWTASLLEDIAVVAGLWTALHHPMIFLGLFILFILLAIWLLPKIWHGLKALFIRLKKCFVNQAAPPPPSSNDNNSIRPTLN